MTLDEISTIGIGDLLLRGGETKYLVLDSYRCQRRRGGRIWREISMLRLVDDNMQQTYDETFQDVELSQGIWCILAKAEKRVE